MLARPRVRLAAASCAIAAALAGCGDDLGPAGPAGDLASLEVLVEAYEAGAITRDQFRAGVAAYPDSAAPDELGAVIAAATLLTDRGTPWEVPADLVVEPGAVLVIEAGAELVLGDEVDVTVLGRLYAVGAEEAPVSIRAADGARYGGLYLSGGPNQLVHAALEGGTRNLYVDHPRDTRTLVESCRFDRWSSLAIGQLDSSGLHVLRSRFGYDTPADEELAEAIRTRGSGGVTIEECAFSHRRGYRDVLDLEECEEGSWPLVLRNRFDGGEDDAIDLDNCSAMVIGNLIRDFRPADLEVQVGGVNGGGVTGDRIRARPFIAGNVIDGCYHAIGFKDGSRPVIVNNTITNSNIGITLYQSAPGRPMPQGIAVNNVLWNNVGWQDGAPADVVLHGRWWPGYNQEDEVQGALDARYNITGSLDEPLPGEGNLAADPLLDEEDGAPVPAAGSPAIDSALEEPWFEDLPMDLALELMERDFTGARRARSGDRFPGLDRGAVEAR